MRPRAKKVAPAWKGETQKRPAMSKTIPAPVRGWVLNENPLGVQSGGARILDNWLCTTRAVRVRGGCIPISDIGAPIFSLIPYQSDVEKLFAATQGAMFDAVSGSLAVTGLTNGVFSFTQFGTAGGSYIYAVNGSDNAMLYDGGSWQQITGTSPLAITGVDTSDFTQVWNFGSRVWFCERDTMSAWYLPVGSIAGAATEFSLASVFSRGGSLLFGAKWSLDAGDGMDDKCVFVTSQGEVAVYSGSDPSSGFTKEGVYRIPKPLGPLGFTQAGGDLLIATESGLIPISAVLTTDRGAIEAKAVSAPIHSYWTQQAARFTTDSWRLHKSSEMDVLLTIHPTGSSATKSCMATHLLTGAWSRITGWDVKCAAEYGGRTYFAGSGGKVYLADEGGNDDGEAYTVSFLGSFDGLDAYGQQKTILQMRALFETSSDFAPKISAKADYDENLPNAPDPAAISGANLWGSGLWGVATWGGGSRAIASASWASVGVTGASLAPVVQVSFNSGAKPDVALVSIDIQYSIGAMVA